MGLLGLMTQIQNLLSKKHYRETPAGPGTFNERDKRIHLVEQ